MERRSERARVAWCDALIARRRGWPEWTELERRVRDRRFSQHAVGPHRFIWAPGDGGEPPLSRPITARGEPVPEMAAPFPAWLAPLVGVECRDSGDLSASGTVAGDLWPPHRLRPIATEAEWCDAWHFEPLERPLERPIYVFQRNRSGTPLFSDGADVLAYAEETRSLVRVGAIEAFIRFCLGEALRGDDWSAAWRRGDGARHGLRSSPSF